MVMKKEIYSLNYLKGICAILVVLILCYYVTLAFRETKWTRKYLLGEKQ